MRERKKEREREIERERKRERKRERETYQLQPEQFVYQQRVLNISYSPNFSLSYPLSLRATKKPDLL